jgi:hypothetical protein
MLRVLKVMPGVSESSLGKTTSHGVVNTFIEYRAAEGSRWEPPTRFVLQQSSKQSSNGSFFFYTVLPGIGPKDTHVTDAVRHNWKAECGVYAGVMFE